jgi:hypothetical protein
VEGLEVAFSAGGGEFADLALELGEPDVVNDDGDEVGVGEIAVIVGFFLIALVDGDFAGVVPAVGGFSAEVAGFEPLVELALDFVGGGFFEDGEAVEIFDFGDGGFVDGAGLVGDVEVDVRLESHVAHLHMAFGDAEVLDDFLEFLREGGDLFWGGEVGFGDDFEKWGSGAVEIDDGVVDGVSTGGFVEELAGVFFEVSAADAYCFGGAVVIGDIEGSGGAEWEIVLGDLVVFWEVGVVVGLAVPLGEGGDLAAECEADLDGVFDGAFVDDGEHAGQAEDLGVNEGVWGLAEGVGGGGEHFGPGGELDVDFQANQDFIGLADAIGHVGTPRSVGVGSIAEEAGREECGERGCGGAAAFV